MRCRSSGDGSKPVEEGGACTARNGACTRYPGNGFGAEDDDDMVRTCRASGVGFTRDGREKSARGPASIRKSPPSAPLRRRCSNCVRKARSRLTDGAGATRATARNFAPGPAADLSSLSYAKAATQDGRESNTTAGHAKMHPRFPRGPNRRNRAHAFLQTGLRSRAHGLEWFLDKSRKEPRRIAVLITCPPRQCPRSRLPDTAQ